MPDKKVCNRCGKELDFFDCQEDYSIHKHVGYGSKLDYCIVDLQLCCECFDRLVEECVISPVSGIYE